MDGNIQAYGFETLVLPEDRKHMLSMQPHAGCGIYLKKKQNYALNSDAYINKFNYIIISGHCCLMLKKKTQMTFFRKGGT